MKRIFLILLLTLLTAKVSFADLVYYSTLRTNDRNSGPKVAVAIVASASILWLCYWYFGGGKDAHELDKVGEINYPDHTEKVERK